MNEDAAGRKVILVEDNLEVSRMYERAFRLHGHDVELMYDGETALERLMNPASTVPEAIIMDVLLPHKNGKELLADIRRDPRLKSVPVAILTNSFHKEDEQQFFDLGADLYLVKIDHQSKQVVEAIETLINKQKNAL
jgi:DNA-binding response OmpR family regulator